MSNLEASRARVPHRSLRAAVFLILVQCVLLAFPSDSWVVPGLLAAVAVSRLWTIRNGWSLRLPTLWNALFLAIVFALKFALFPTQYSTDAPFINTELAHEIGCWLIAVQLLTLHDARSLKRIPATVGAMGCIAVLCAGDIRLHTVSREVMLVGMVLFVGGLGWFAHSSRDWIRVDQKRRLRRSIMVGTLIAAAIPTVLAAQAWHRHERDLEMLLIRLMKSLDGETQDPRTTHRSFLQQVTNGRIQNPEELVLKVRQSAPDPPYLRGWCYDEYVAYGWSQSRFHQKLDLLESRVPSESGPWEANRPLFALHAPASNEWSTVEVENLTHAEPIPYVPWETAELQIPVNQLNVDHRRNLTLVEESMPSQIVAFVPSRIVEQPEPELDSAVLQVPAKLDPRVRDLATELLKNATTDRERMRAVEQFFHQNYLYQVGLEPPKDQDPIVHFLLERPPPPAHCEYFATGAALLLRLGGVPARYVTGFVPSESHSGGEWIARRKDGHAWVEAYDRQSRQWVLVEATPSNGLPDRRDASWAAAWAERWRIWSASFRQRFQQFGTWSALGLILQTPLARILLGLVFIAAWVLITRKYRRQAVAKQAANERLVTSVQLLELDEQLSRQGFARRPGETLLQFRDRVSVSSTSQTLQPILDWYGVYSDIRYDEAGRTTEKLGELEAAWQRIPRTSR